MWRRAHVKLSASAAPPLTRRRNPLVQAIGADFPSDVRSNMKIQRSPRMLQPLLRGTLSLADNAIPPRTFFPPPQQTLAGNKGFEYSWLPPMHLAVVAQITSRLWIADSSVSKTYARSARCLEHLSTNHVADAFEQGKGSRVKAAVVTPRTTCSPASYFGSDVGPWSTALGNAPRLDLS